MRRRLVADLVTRSRDSHRDFPHSSRIKRTFSFNLGEKPPQRGVLVSFNHLNNRTNSCTAQIFFFSSCFAKKTLCGAREKMPCTRKSGKIGILIFCTARRILGAAKCGAGPARRGWRPRFFFDSESFEGPIDWPSGRRYNSLRAFKRTVPTAVFR